MSELQAETKVRISIDRETYRAPSLIRGVALYELAEIGEREELFREVRGDHDDELVCRDASEIRLSDDQHFYSQKATDIVVNAEPKEVVKRRLTFDDVVRLAYPAPLPGTSILYAVIYRHGPSHHPKGSLVAGESVKIREGMIFNVSATDRS